MWFLTAGVLNTRWKVGIVSIVVFYILWNVGTEINRGDKRLIPAFLALVVAIWLYRKVRRATRRSNPVVTPVPASADSIV